VAILASRCHSAWKIGSDSISMKQLMEQLHYNLLHRWFVGLGADEPV
jgi:hypothetical protein